MENTVSIVIAPDTMKPRLSDTSVTTGRRALRVACRRRTSTSAQALGAGRLQVVLAHLVEQRRSHDERVLREIGQA